MATPHHVLITVGQAAPLSLPTSDDDPFWMAFDALCEGIATNFQRHGITPEKPRRKRVRHGSLVCVNSDAPDWALYAYFDVPIEPARRREVMELALTHLSAARHALPHANWEVTRGGVPFAWNPTQGFEEPTA